MNELCEIVTPDPVLSKYELQGLRNLREWLPNQDNEMYPDELDKKQALLDSMMVGVTEHCYTQLFNVFNVCNTVVILRLVICNWQCY
mgnify:FL=1